MKKIENDSTEKLYAYVSIVDRDIFTVKQIANFYNTTEKAIVTIIQRSMSEFIDDGVVVLDRNSFNDFLIKNDFDVNDYEEGCSTMLLPNSSFKRIGMLFGGDNFYAQFTRDYMLGIEHDASVKERKKYIDAEVARIERTRLESAIAKYIPDSAHKKFAYPNYTNMIYDVVFGKTAKELKDERGATDENLRDKFTEEELKVIEEMESIVVGLLAMDFTYKQIKDALVNRFQKRLEDKK